MAKIIIIDKQFETEDEGALLLEYIASHIKEGYTSGFFPHWRIEEAQTDED